MGRRLFQWVIVVALLALTIYESAAQEVPVFDWTRPFGSNGFDFAESITTDAIGNVYTTGLFSNTADFDPGAPVFNITSAGGSDVFISKVDANGGFVWAKSIGGTGGEDGVSLATDLSGNVYVTGHFVGTMDFDPGPGVFNLTTLTALDEVFLLKLNTAGDFVWAYSIGTTVGAGAECKAIDVDPSGFVYITGWFSGTVDFDPGTGIFNLTSNGQRDMFISKLDTNGNLVWAKRLGENLDDYSWSLTTDAAGNVYTIGWFYSTVDFDPGPGVFNLTSVGGLDLFILKLDTNGSFSWAIRLGNAGNQDGLEIAVDGSGNVYMTGDFDGTLDFDPGPGTFNINAGSSVDAFVLKLDAAGTFVWAEAIATTAGYCTSNSITIDTSGKVIIAGYLNGTADFDPGVSTNLLAASSSIFYQKLDGNGNLIWATLVGPVGTAALSGFYNSVTGDSFGNIYGTAAFDGTGDFDGGACTNNLSGSNDFFIQKISVGIVIPPPTVTSFTPASGPVGTPVTITGTNFSVTPANNAVKFNLTSAVVSASTSTTIDTSVPAGATTGKISVTIGCVTVQSTANFTVGSSPLPTITSFSPTSGPVGIPVTITGTNFSSTPSSNTVKFNGTTASVTASTSTSISTSVPAGATTGTISVTVAGNTATSGSNFTVTTSPIITITVHPQPATVCNSAVVMFSTVASGTTNITYRWQFSVDGIAPFADVVSGGGYSNAATSVLSVNTSGTFGAGQYRCRINGDLATQVITNNAALLINPIPPAPASTGNSGCASTSILLGATGGLPGEFRWYTLASGGVPIPGEVNNSYSTPAITTTTTYYVSINNGTCESPRTPVTATAVALPTAPAVTAGIGCAPSAAILLNASGGSSGQYRWYTVAAGGSPIAGETNSSYSTLLLAVSTTFYVCINNGICESARTSVLAEIRSCTPTIAAATAETTVGASVTIDISPLVSVISDPIDLASIKVIVQPSSGALATTSAGVLEVDYSGVEFAGIDQLSIEACDVAGHCAQRDVTIDVVGDITVYNAVSPNGDGKNDTFTIQYIEALPETQKNKVSIFNRWGTVVYEVADYNNSSNVFKGLSNSGEELPSGTYYYTIEFASGATKRNGFISLRR